MDIDITFFLISLWVDSHVLNTEDQVYVCNITFIVNDAFQFQTVLL